MAIMIFLGVMIRKSGIFRLSDLSFFYFFMGIPLFLSSIRFVRAWKFQFRSAEKK